jgi:Putative peptidoglycan binding domain
LSRYIALAGSALLLALPASASAAAHLGDRTLRTGSRGHDVRVLQDFLTRVGISTPVTGYYGPETRGHVRSFERKHGLAADGVTTPAVARMLRQVASTAGGASLTAPLAPPGRARLNPDGTASAPSNAPPAVRALIAAGNQIAFKPYVWGGGHGHWTDRGYDCSGSVSFALHGGGLLSVSRDSTGFESYGSAGKGRWVTIYANGGHAYMTVAGLRFDTSGRSGASGSRWQAAHRSGAGYVVRHPTRY